MIKKFLFFILVFISFPCYSWDINPEFHIGNDSRYINSIKIQSETVLNGKRILFIGSSVTRGAASMSISFADMLQKKYNINMIKDAIDGSTLVDVDNKSYISRLKKYTTDDNIDLLVVQLSTNDSYKNFPIYGGKDSIENAIFTIIAYAEEILNCPVLFFTNPPPVNNTKYKEMVTLLQEIKKKRKIYIIDIFNNEEFNSMSQYEYQLSMFDYVHPTLAGYSHWLPYFENALKEIFIKK